MAENPWASAGGEQLSNLIIEHRIKLLSEDRDLAELHRDLVMSCILTEQKFWDTRKSSLDADGKKTSKLKMGFKNTMLADVRPLVDGQANKVTFCLTPEIIHQIFIEKPAVLRAFFDLVPSKMSEKDFWTKYFRAEYLLSSRNSATVAAEVAEDEELALFLKPDDIVASESRRKIRRVDPTVDLEADLGDGYMQFSNHGILCDGTKELVDAENELPIRSFAEVVNQHAAVVLEGRSSDVELGDDTRAVAEALERSRQATSTETSDQNDYLERLERVTRMTEIDDLQAPKYLPFVPLCIKGPHEYSYCHQGHAIRALGDNGAGGKPTNFTLSSEEAYVCLRGLTSEIKLRGLSDPVVLPHIALKVINVLTDQHILSTKHLGKSPQESVPGSLSSTTRKDLMHCWRSIQELLYHFWSTYPVNTQDLENKVVRLKDAMEHRYSKLQQMKEAAPSDYRHQVSLLVQPMLQALDAAFAHYDIVHQKQSM